MSFDRNTYETPQWLFDWYNEIFQFKWDLACSVDNSKCPYGLTRGSLETNWAALAPGQWLWLNPPYKPLKPWIEKAYMAADRGAKIIALVPMQTLGTLYFDPTRLWGIDFIRGRVNFCYQGKTIRGNEHCSVALMFDNNQVAGVPAISWTDAKEAEEAWLLS